MNVCATPSRKNATAAGTIIIALILLIGLPVAGALTAGESIDRYLEFPPLTRYVKHKIFSWPIAASITLFVMAVIGPIVVRVLRTQHSVSGNPVPRTAFPWWGWVGMVWLAIAWVLAWNRFDWFVPLQHHTFMPLWLGYIVIVNALTFTRGGRCLIIDRPVHLFLLFVVSAIFWWYFEFLNRFVQNWYYAGIGEFSTGEYILFGTLSFSTVLPAVVSTRDLLATFPRLGAGLDQYVRTNLANSCFLPSVVLIVSAIALANIGRWPDYLFPMVWVAPLLVLTSLQALRGEPHIFQTLASGNWQPIWLAALAALTCGFFWEMWNFGSLAHWEYTVPFVQRYPLFEMPLLGYAGYLPFGIGCIAIANCVPTARTDPGPDKRY